MSEEVFDQELGLIRTRQRWISEQIERIENQLEDFHRNDINPQSIEILRQRLATKLASATLEDRRFILEAIGAKVYVQPEGTWDLEIQVPREIVESEADLQVVNSSPGWIYT